MAIKARVFEGVNIDEGTGRGECIFVSVPSPGDRLVLPAVTGDLDILEVLFVEHYPIKVVDEKSTKVERIIAETEDPSMTIYSKFIERDSGG